MLCVCVCVCVSVSYQRHGNQEHGYSWAPLLTLCQQMTLSKDDVICRVRVCDCNPILILAWSAMMSIEEVFVVGQDRDLSDYFTDRLTDHMQIDETP